jgi:phage baseplate assembly protein W
MYIAAPTRSEWSLRHGHVGDRRDEGHLEWAASAAVGQSSDLRAERHAAVDGSNPNTCQRNVAMNIAFPLMFDERGRTAEADDDLHARQMIEQLLFTSPGERVNRPTFGCGLMQLVFAPNSPELAAAVQLTVQAALQQWLGDLIQVHKLEVTSQDSTLKVELEYNLRRTGQTQRAEFTRTV